MYSLAASNIAVGLVRTKISVESMKKRKKYKCHLLDDIKGVNGEKNSTNSDPHLKNVEIIY